MPEGTRNIAVDAELFGNLREYCDRNELRFADFIEDALETATYRRELEELVGDKTVMENRIAKERYAAIGEGFHKGVLIATLVFAGNGTIARALTPEEAKGCVISQPVSGEQLPLF